jgi:hypothetical protein
MQIVYAGKYVDWCRTNIPLDRVFDNKFDMYRLVVDSYGLNDAIDYLEFGVYRGKTLNWWVTNVTAPSAQFVGFDTFTGLPEDWTAKLRKGAYSTQGQLPAISDDRVAYEIGLFQDTLGPFLQKNSLERRLVVHIDSDLYSSALYVLTAIASRLKRDDILLLDEVSAVTHEFRALLDFTSAYRVKLGGIAAANHFSQIALEVQ